LLLLLSLMDLDLFLRFNTDFVYFSKAFELIKFGLFDLEFLSSNWKNLFNLRSFLLS
jgi:hypothetical protein